METKLQEMLDSSCGLFNLIDEKTEIMKRADAKGELCVILKFELLSFLCCLSACDGRISRIEAELIRRYFDVEMYPIHIKEFNHNHQIGSKEYYKKIPECLKLAVGVDNYMIEHGQQVDKGVSEIVIELFKNII